MRVGRSNKPLSELSDRELEEELMRRRRERAKRRDGRSRGRDVSPQDKQIAQYFANLELEPDATVDDVKDAYRDLMKKYHPDRHVDDPAKHKAATKLAQSLTEAYQNLLKHLSSD